MLCVVVLSVTCFSMFSQVNSLGNDSIDLSSLSLKDLTSLDVSVQKRDQNILTVPVTTTAITEKEIQLNRIYSMEQLHYVVPGFFFGRSGSDARPTIRGMGTRQIQANGDPVIGYFIDGVYQSRTSMGMLPYVDAQRIEVQRGPQGTFFGRNTIGGNISVTSNAPTDKFDIGISSELGNFNSSVITTFINVPLSKKVLSRFAMLYDKHDGYLDNLAFPFMSRGEKGLQDQNQIFFRSTFKFLISDHIDLTVRNSRWEQSGNGAGVWNAVSLGALTDVNTGLGSINGEVNTIGIDTLGISRRQVNINRLTRRYGIQNLLSAELNANLGFGDLKAITAYNDFVAYRSMDSDESPSTSWDAYEFFKTPSKTFTQEVNLISNNEEYDFKWLVGAFFLNEAIDETIHWSAVGASPWVGVEEVNTSSYALYGQGSYNPLEKLRFIFGGRYTVDQKFFKGWSDYGIDTSQVYSSPTWKFGVDYSFDEQNLLYGSISTGYKSGGFNENLDAPTFDPEEVLAYEIGSKNVFLNEKVQLNLAVFSNYYYDLQVQSYNPTSKTTYFVNAGESSAKGVELELATSPSDKLLIKGMFSYIVSTYDVFESSPNPFYKEAFSPASEPVSLNLSGNDLERSPSLRASLLVNYEIAIGKAGFLTPFIRSSFTGDYYTTQYNTELDFQKGYTSTDIRLIWTHKNRKLGADVFVTNIEDNIALKNAVIGSSLKGNVSMPRLFGARLVYNY